LTNNWCLKLHFFIAGGMGAFICVHAASNIPYPQDIAKLQQQNSGTQVDGVDFCLSWN
jgi:hypothetical protein